MLITEKIVSMHIRSIYDYVSLINQCKIYLIQLKKEEKGSRYPSEGLPTSLFSCCCEFNYLYTVVAMII